MSSAFRFRQKKIDFFKQLEWYDPLIIIVINPKIVHFPDFFLSLQIKSLWLFVLAGGNADSGHEETSVVLKVGKENFSQGGYALSLSKRIIIREIKERDWLTVGV